MTRRKKDPTLERLAAEHPAKLRRLEQAQNRLDRQQALIRQRTRKRTNRVKYLVGACVLIQMQKDPVFKKQITDILDAETAKPADREFLNDYAGLSLPITKISPKKSQ